MKLTEVWNGITPLDEITPMDENLGSQDIVPQVKKRKEKKNS